MSSLITAHFDSIDMATLAARGVASRITEIESINVMSKPLERGRNHDRDMLLLATPYNATDYTNGMMSTTTQPYLANAAVLTQLTNNYLPLDARIQKVRIEIKTTSDNIQAINSTLRSFGGLGITQRDGIGH